MTDIGVYTDEWTLYDKVEHSKDPNKYVWWDIGREPKNLPDRIFFATNKRWCGYFTIEGLDVVEDKLRIFLDEWHELDNKPERSPFQGFTYKVQEVD